MDISSTLSDKSGSFLEWRERIAFFVQLPIFPGTVPESDTETPGKVEGVGVTGTLGYLGYPES